MKPALMRAQRISSPNRKMVSDWKMAFCNVPMSLISGLGLGHADNPLSDTLARRSLCHNAAGIQHCRQY